VGKAGNNLTSGIDFKRVLNKYLKNWYLFAIAIMIAYMSASVTNRYVIPIYSLSTSVLIEDKSNKSMLDQRGSISADPLFLNSKLIDNQISLLKSFAQIKLIIQRLNFDVSYFAKGKYIWEEVYKRAPFVVRFDSGHPQIKGVRLDIRFNGKENFQVWSENLGIFKKPRNYRFGETISGKDYSFTVMLKDSINPLDYSGQ
jgi:uncharacterized protein involved in exopolysaccharide biosynthesis